MKNKEKEQLKALLSALREHKKSMLKLFKNWPLIRKELAEAQKNKPRLTDEEDAIVDALT